MFHVRVNGIDVSCDTPAEAVALANQAAKYVRTSGKEVQNGSTASKKSEQKIKEIRRFLSAIARAGEQGTGGEELVKSVGCETASALGGVVSMTQRQLESMNIAFNDVAVRFRKGNSKLWKGGPKLLEAIEKLNDI